METTSKLYREWLEVESQIQGAMIPPTATKDVVPESLLPFLDPYIDEFVSVGKNGKDYGNRGFKISNISDFRAELTNLKESGNFATYQKYWIMRVGMEDYLTVKGIF